MNIRIINSSKRLSTADLGTLVKAMTVYTAAVAKAWNMSAPTITVGQPDPTATINAFLVEEFPAGAPTNALGYHNVSAFMTDGIKRTACYINVALTMPASVTHITPFGTYLPKYGIISQGSLSECLSHELAEAMIDPNINTFKYDSATNKSWLVEVGDHAHAYRWVVPIKTSLVATTNCIVADFTLPSFYSLTAKAPYSYTGQVKAPFQLDNGCYAYTVSGQPAPDVSANVKDDDDE